MNEIDQRLTDSEWDFNIAKRVIGKKRIQERTIAAATCLLSICIAVIGLTLYFSPLHTNVINQQITGMYKSQYSNSTVSGEETDSFILETLAKR
jgi:predicted PurR-regulated permease PerM